MSEPVTTANTIPFDVNQTDFPSLRSKEIWEIGKNIVPLEISLAGITDSEMREGCAQVLQLMQELLSNMYAQPEKYSNHKIDLFFTLYIKYGARLDESGQNWIIPSEAHKKYMKKFCDFVSVFSMYGFKISETGNSAILSNEKYPLFLKYWYSYIGLCQKRGVSILSCDFRVFVPKFKFTFDDLLRTKSDKEKVYFTELHEYAIGKGAKLETNNQYRRYRYIYKNEYVLVLDPYIAVQYNNQYSNKRNSWTSFDLFMAVVEKQSDKDELIKYIQKEICVCNACKSRKAGSKKADERCGHWLDIHGVRRMAAACHPEISKCHIPVESQSYTDYDTKLLKRMMDMRFEQINHYDSL